MKNSAIILGAGASKGARVGTETPPLDAEFFEVGRKILAGRGRASRPAKMAWKAFLTAIDNAGLKESSVLSWRLEEVSTYLEARIKMNKLQINRGNPRRFADLLDALKRVICFVLLEANGNKVCSLHQKLFELIDPDCLITFNYDLIADSTLLTMRRLPWARREYSGYGAMRAFPIRVYNAAGQFSDTNVYPGRANDAVRLFKLHGSMHWEANQRGPRHRLAVGAVLQPGQPIQFYVPPSSPLIVPPVAAKMEIRETHLNPLWISARKLLTRAPSWIVWGYSFPQSDTATMVLFRTALERNRSYKPVIVINPDREAANRIKKYLRKVTVKHFPSMEKFLLDNRVTLSP